MTTKKDASGKNMTVRKAMLVMNEASTMLHSILRERAQALGGLDSDPRRKVDKECGYNENPDTEDFAKMYRRFGLASRVVNLLPDECFAVEPEIYETERPRDTPFEKGWKALVKHPDLNPYYFLHKVDALSGVGRFGALLIGVNDGKAMNSIADGMNEDGTPRPRAGSRTRKLLYLRALDETYLKVKQSQTDANNPRYGHPLIYQMKSELVEGEGVTKTEWLDVHWSRILHVAESRTASELYAEEKMRGVYDHLCDTRKILGGSGEMFWKGGFPGIAATVDPRFIEAGGVDVDEETITDEMQRFMDGLQRYILGVGFQINSLSPQVADPTAHLMMQFTVIAMALGVPLRVFMGSEEAKLASGQDIKAWNKRLAKRQNKYLSPRVVRPFVNRMIALGVLPPTKKTDDFGFPVFDIFWPDIAMPDENERSTIADRRAAAMLKYVTGKCHQMMQPSDFLRFVLDFQIDEINQIMANAKKPPEIEFKEDKPELPGGAKPFGGKKAKGPADSGVKGSPPSDRADSNAAVK